MTSKLRDQVALITGAREGIGLAIGRELGMQGATVVLISRGVGVRQAAQKLASEGLTVCGMEADVSDPDAVKALVADCLDRFNRVDILVNNAGVGGGGPIEEISIEEWNEVFRNNLTTVFLCSKHVFPAMKQQRSGTIVNISSVAGRFRSSVAGVHYTASKAAIIGFTRQLALEGAPLGIRVNAIAPAQTDTEMLREGLAKTNKTVEDIARQIPLGYIARPEQIASVCAFLCSEDSSYMTGAIVDVNGGTI